MGQEKEVSSITLNINKHPNKQIIMRQDGLTSRFSTDKLSDNIKIGDRDTHNVSPVSHLYHS